MKSLRFFLALFILMIITMACSLTSATPTPSNVLFSDDFSKTSQKWDQVTEDTRSTGYYNDAYRITINDTNSDAWANPGNESFTDVQIEVDATKNGGPDDNDFGLICRYTGVDQFYYAVVSSDGFYGIMKMSADGGAPIGNDSLLETDKVVQGASTNHLRFDCIGPNLTLYVNGNLVDQQTDADYTTGNVGLIAGTFDTVGTDMLFDNFFVYKP